MTTTITKEPPMERYSLRGEHGCWATIALRGWERPSTSGIMHGGEILINSDYGNYAYSWGNMGSTLKWFLVSIDRGYLLDKLAGLSLYEFDFDASVARVRREIIRERRDRSIDAEEAREAWHQIPCEDCGKDLFINALFGCEPLGDEPWHFVEQRERPALVGFYDHVWMPFVEHLRAEIAGEAEHA
jgi:hypothetical protein